MLIRQLKEDEAIAAADTLLLTVPSQLGMASLNNTITVQAVFTRQ